MKTPGDVLDELSKEMDGALIMPSSRFENAAQLITEYDHVFDGLRKTDASELAGAYLNGIARARTDGRYFGRNMFEVEEKFGRDGEDKAGKAIVDFLEGHSVKLIGEEEYNKRHVDGRRYVEHLLEYANPSRAFVDAPKWIDGEIQNPPIDLEVRRSR